MPFFPQLFPVESFYLGLISFWPSFPVDNARRTRLPEEPSDRPVPRAPIPPSWRRRGVRSGESRRLMKSSASPFSVAPLRARRAAGRPAGMQQKEHKSKKRRSHRPRETAPVRRAGAVESAREVLNAGSRVHRVHRDESSAMLAYPECPPSISLNGLTHAS